MEVGSIPTGDTKFIYNLIVIVLQFIRKGDIMPGRYIVRKFKNGVKHFWDTEKRECIHHSKVKELIPKKEFDVLFKQFNSKQPQKEVIAESLPKLSDILNEVIDLYSVKISLEEIVGALELAKTRALTLHKQK